MRLSRTERQNNVPHRNLLGLCPAEASSTGVRRWSRTARMASRDALPSSSETSIRTTTVRCRSMMRSTRSTCTSLGMTMFAETLTPCAVAASIVASRAASLRSASFVDARCGPRTAASSRGVVPNTLRLIRSSPASAAAGRTAAPFSPFEVSPTVSPKRRAIVMRPGKSGCRVGSLPVRWTSLSPLSCGVSFRFRQSITINATGVLSFAVDCVSYLESRVMQQRFFSAEGWESWGLDDRPVIPEVSP